MKPLHKYRIAVISLTVLVIVAVSALITTVYHQRQDARQSGYSVRSEKCSATAAVLRDELGLTNTQLSKIQSSCDACRGFNRCSRDTLNTLKSEFIAELSGKVSDTVQLNRIADAFGKAQAAIMKGMIRQYLEIKAVCTPEQRIKLSRLYSELFGSCTNRGGGMHRYGKKPDPATGCCNDLPEN